MGNLKEAMDRVPVEFPSSDLILPSSSLWAWKQLTNSGSEITIVHFTGCLLCASNTASSSEWCRLRLAIVSPMLLQMRKSDSPGGWKMELGLSPGNPRL